MSYLYFFYFMVLALGKGDNDASGSRLVYVRTDTGAVAFKSYVVLFRQSNGYKMIHTDRTKGGLYVKTVAYGEFSHSILGFTVDNKCEVHYSRHPYILGDLIQKDSVVMVRDYMATYWGDVYGDSLTLKSANIYAGRPADNHGVYYLMR